MISKDKIQKFLNEKGVNLNKIATDPRVFDRACDIVYKSTPIPWRWFIGKRRLKKTMNKLKEKIAQTEDSLQNDNH